MSETAPKRTIQAFAVTRGNYLLHVMPPEDDDAVAGWKFPEGSDPTVAQGASGTLIELHPEGFGSSSQERFFNLVDCVQTAAGATGRRFNRSVTQIGADESVEFTSY